MPATVEACIADHRAQTYADSVMYRHALRAAAEARGWSVHFYDRDRVLASEELDARARAIGRAAGPPWQASHRLAAAAALAAQRTD